MTITLVRKVQEQDSELTRTLHRVADQAERRFASSFLAGIDQIRRRITEAQVALALASDAGVQRLLALVVAEPVIKQQDPVTHAFAEVMGNTARAVLPGLAADLGVDTAELGLRFDIDNPLVAAHAARHAAELVREVSGETMRNVRRVIVDSIQQGRTPYATSKLLESVVGLHSRQTRAVLNFRRGLEEAAAGARSTRGIPRQFTLSPKLGKGPLTPARIDTLTGQYAQRQLRYRAMTIARTEAMNAANAGQQLAWESMIRKGVLPKNARKVWVVVHDDRLCERCAPMEGKTVQVTSRFTETERGLLPAQRVPVKGTTTRYPPLHPSCRCTLRLARRVRGIQPPVSPPVAPPTPPPVAPTPPPAPPQIPRYLQPRTRRPAAPRAPRPKPGDLGAMPPLKTPETATEAVALLKERYPWLKVGFGVGRNVADIRTIQDMVEAFDEMARRFPKVAKRVKQLGTKSLGEGTYAVANQIDRYLLVNSKWAKDYPRFASSSASGKRSGFSSTSTIQGTVRHEFGHHIDYMLGQLKAGDRSMATVYTYVGHRRGADEWIMQKLAKFYRRSEAEVNWMLPANRTMKSRITADLSRYSTTNGREFMAEALAEATGPNPRPLAKFILDELEKDFGAKFR